MKNCCKSSKKDKKCIRKKDRKTFKLPRKFSKKKCTKGKVKGFTMRSSCAPYKFCKKGGSLNNNINGICVMEPNKKIKKNNVKGIINLIDKGENIEIKYEFDNLKKGYHGFHIHEYGDLTDGCKSAGSHFSLNKNHKHGSKKDNKKHNGDLGNVYCKSGKKCKGKMIVSSKQITLRNKKNNILGRSFVIHKEKDDLGKGGNEESLKTGNAGARLACGVIGLKK